MHPQQPQNNNNPNNTPPQPYGQGPQPYYGPPQGPNQPPSQYQANPQGYGTPPHHPGQQPPAQPQQNANWYQAPEPTKQDTAPSKASEYVSRATTPPIQQGQLVSGQYSIDYLNSMSGSAPKKFSNKFIAIAAGALVLSIGLVGALLFLMPKQDTTPAATLSTVYTIMFDTREVTKGAGKNIKNSKLKGINSSLDTVLLSTMQKIEAPLVKSGTKTSVLKAAAKKPPVKDEDLREKLEEARLLVMYDRVYLMQMEFKIQEIIRRIDYVHQRTGSDATKESLREGKESLQRIKESIDGFSENNDSSII